MTEARGWVMQGGAMSQRTAGTYLQKLEYAKKWILPWSLQKELPLPTAGLQNL